MRRLCTGTPETSCPRARWSACGAATGPRRRARVADELGRAHGRARRGVDLAGVVGLDDLDGVEEASGERREGGAEDAADREVRDEQHRAGVSCPRMNWAISAMRSLDQPDVPTTIGMPAPGGELDDAGARGGVRDVEGDVGAEHLVEARARVERRVQFEVVGCLDELDRQSPHLARGSGHGDPYRHGLHPSKRPHGAGRAERSADRESRCRGRPP